MHILMLDKEILIQSACIFVIIRIFEKDAISSLLLGAVQGLSNLKLIYAGKPL